MTRPAVLDPATDRPGTAAAHLPSVVPAIDEALRCIGSRQLVPTSEVVDLLLDLRLVARLEELLTSQ
jgi:hypothetical protein